MIIASVSMATDHLAMVIVTKALDKKDRKCLASRDEKKKIHQVIDLK